MKENNLLTPKTYFYLGNNRRPLKIYLSPKRAKIWLSSEAKLRKIFDVYKTVKVRVVYGRDLDVWNKNEGIYNNLQDLKQATYAFLEEDLWIKK